VAELAVSLVGGVSLLDFAYIAGTVVFFVLMLAFVRGCAALGRESNGERDK
jgi:hypothetical protein